jgi:hypothetical protein
MLDWDGERIDDVDGGLTWYGLRATPLLVPDRTGVTGELRATPPYLAAGGPTEVARRAAGRLRRWAKSS